ncbi:RdRP-domain-containing protein [Hypomontagnella monticulosa]|nr:RdRP-domain-containing protein [Hypomontagnella monticulosa]
MEGLEVFMPDLPIGLTDIGLKTQLTPFINVGLRIVDWACQKYRGKTFGTVTFLRRTDGERFLAVHGETLVQRNGVQRTRSQLKILGQWIKCKRSHKNPDPFLLKSILKAAEDRRLQLEEKDEENERPRAKDKKVSLELRGLSCGHYEYLSDKFAYTQDIVWPVRGVVRFARDTIVVLFDAIRMEVPYRTIHEIIVSERPTSLTLTLWEAPRFFEVGEDFVFMMTAMGLYGPPSANRTDRTRLSQLPHTGANHAAILGQSLVYNIQVSPSDFTFKLQQLKQKEKLNFSYYDFRDVLQGRTYMADGMKTIKILLDNCNATSAVPFDVLFQFQALVHNGYLLPQTVETILKRLCETAQTNSSNGSSSGKANGNHGTANGNEGVSGVKKKTSSSCPFSADAVKKLFSQIPFPGPDIEASTFSPSEIWSFLLANEKEIRQGTAKELISERARQNLIMVYKIQVTPSRITLLGPEAEAKNRILRKFPHHIEYFARVQFCEEDGQDIFFNAKVSLGEVWARFKKVLLDGIHIAGREYKFLGFSHSSLRAHSVWFMAPFVDHQGNFQTYFSVISELGNFNKIRSPPRCAARIGQAFSETPFSIDLVELGVDIQLVPDVKSRDGSRVFSDGVGTISRPLMEAIQAALPNNRDTTTCFQIRWGGAKGMLALDDTLGGMVMRIRPESMVKFESQDVRNLEICDMGNKPIPLVLNRQMIKILEDMNVAEEWFTRVQNRELDRLRMITAHVHNTVTFLKRQKIADQINFSKFIRRLHKQGIDYRRDSFLCSVVETVVLKEVRLLKHKARIPVENGVTLFGIMDEFGFLEEDEIYFTFEKKKLYGNHDPVMHDQLVLVTRSPALHPGDIQIRRSVVPPRGHPLRSLSNCVVFSQKGGRDLPSQLSGGDLDGDIYNIIWDRLAVGSCSREFAPADYPRVSPLTIDREVTREDMTKFFVEFMATDQLGVIAVKHMILADMKSAGTVDEECKLLAEMHSTGVDYSKSGIPIDMMKLRNLTPTRFRPEFLSPAPPANIVDRTEIVFESTKPASLEEEEDEDDESGPKHRWYRSEKILGTLYRAIDEKKIWKQDIHQNVNRQGASVWDQLLLYIKAQCKELGGVNWQAAQDEARRIREAYDDAIWSATMDYSDNFTKGLSELEVFTGCIYNNTGVQTRRQRDKSVRLRDEFNRIAKWVEGVIRKKGIKSREDDDDDSDVDEHGSESASHEPGSLYANNAATALELSLACLHVGNSKSSSFGRSKEDFQTFKVVAAQCALTELELAMHQQDIARGAALMAASMR